MYKFNPGQLEELYRSLQFLTKHKFRFESREHYQICGKIEMTWGLINLGLVLLWICAVYLLDILMRYVLPVSMWQTTSIIIIVVAIIIAKISFVKVFVMVFSRRYYPKDFYLAVVDNITAKHQSELRHRL